MKRQFCFILCLVFSFLLLAAAGAEGGNLPTVSSLIQQGLPDEKTEVSDNLDAYSPLNDGFEEIDNDFVFVVLQREAPLKEFTAKKVYPPFGDDDGFDYDFNGVDVGESRVWLRSDIMKKIPSDYLADSMESAGYLIVAETYYEHARTLIVSTFSDNGDEELPEFENTDEMIQYFLEHPKEVEYMTYYPVFDAYTILSLYDTKTKNVSFIDLAGTSVPYFGRNMEAAGYWDNMWYISELADAVDEETGIDPDYADYLLEIIDFVPEAKTNLWKSCIQAGEYATALYSINEYYWAMAKELENLDPSEENRSNYDLIISDKNKAALRLFVDYCDYSGFERDVEEIGKSGAYIATPDYDWIEQALEELFEDFSEE